MARTQSQLEARFKALGGISDRGSFVRAVALQFQDAPLSAIGSIRRGGRYNPRGDFEALYLGRHPDTVVREIKMVTLDDAGNEIGIAKPPQALVTVRYLLRHIIDLTDGAFRSGWESRGVFRRRTRLGLQRAQPASKLSSFRPHETKASRTSSRSSTSSAPAATWKSTNRRHALASHLLYPTDGNFARWPLSGETLALANTSTRALIAFPLSEN
jgi:hypothetical protein